jgi:hypothetical protein
VFEAIIRKGVAAGDFRELGVEAAATCLVGAFMEGLISALAPGVAGVPARSEEFADSIADLCLAAVAKPTRQRVEQRPAIGAAEPIAQKNLSGTMRQSQSTTPSNRGRAERTHGGSRVSLNRGPAFL